LPPGIKKHKGSFIEFDLKSEYAYAFGIRSKAFLCMANLFDVSNYPQREPFSLVIADRWTWKKDDLTDYPSSAYTLKYSFRLDGAGATEIQITASANGTAFKIEVGASTSTSYTAGNYQWQSYLTRNSDNERVTIDSGYIEIRPNRDLATTDPRSHFKIVLDNIEAVIEERATKDQEAYSINGRSLSRTPIADLQQLADSYRGKYVAEINRHRAKKGLGHHGRLLTRFI
jgi:hypothetical protein